MLLALVGIGGALAWYWLAPISVQVVQPRQGPAVEAVYGSGTVEPSVMIPIAPTLTARLVSLSVDENTLVHKGQVLAQLDDRELVASVAEWEARVRFGESQFKRADELLKSRSGTAVARDQAKSELDIARATLDRVRKQLAETTLVAPADGIIVRRDGEIGQLIRSGEAVFWLSCCETLRISAEIDEEDVPAVKVGQRVVIRADAFPDAILEGTVKEITPKGDPVARTFRVRISLPADTPLMIGMGVDCNIVVAERPGALLVPSSSVQQNKVWLVKDGKLLLRTVSTGVLNSSLVEVTSGLESTDQIVLAPASGLREGRRATAVPAND